MSAVVAQPISLSLSTQTFTEP